MKDESSHSYARMYRQQRDKEVAKKIENNPTTKPLKVNLNDLSDWTSGQKEAEPRNLVEELSVKKDSSRVIKHKEQLAHFTEKVDDFEDYENQYYSKEKYTPHDDFSRYADPAFKHNEFSVNTSHFTNLQDHQKTFDNMDISGMNDYSKNSAFGNLYPKPMLRESVIGSIHPINETREEDSYVDKSRKADTTYFRANNTFVPEVDYSDANIEKVLKEDLNNMNKVEKKTKVEYI